MALNRRILGVLRQYPNPEVAFFTLAVLSLPRQGEAHAYLSPQDSMIDPRTVALDAGDRVYPAWRTAMQAAAEAPGSAAWKRLADGRRFQPQAGRAHSPREMLATDLTELGVEGATTAAKLTRYLQEALTEPKDSTWDWTLRDTPLDTIVPWIARLVNQWLKDEPPQPDYTEFWRTPERAAAVAKADLDWWLHWGRMAKLNRKVIEVADWARAERPDLMRLTPAQALYRVGRWHGKVRRASQAKSIEGSPIVFTSGSWNVHQLKTRDALQAEGQCAHHCVGSYWQDVAAGRTSIFTLRSADLTARPAATIEVADDQRVRQVKGFANAAVTNPEHRRVLAEFFSYYGYKAPDFAKELREVAAAAPKNAVELTVLDGIEPTRRALCGF